MRYLIVVAAVALLASTAAAQTGIPARFAVRELTLADSGLSPAEIDEINREILPDYRNVDGPLESVVSETADRVRTALLERGYFKAAVSDVGYKVVNRTAKYVTIEVAVRVDRGDRYRMGEISFKNPAVFSPEELREQFHIAHGDIFKTKTIRDGLERIRRLYASKGHIDMTCVPDTITDDSAGLVSLVVDIDAGPIYRFGELAVRGVESQPGARQRALELWKRYEGTVYNWDVLTSFLKDIGARPSVRPEQIFEVSQDNSEHLVKVYLTLARPFVPEKPSSNKRP